MELAVYTPPPAIKPVLRDDQLNVKKQVYDHIRDGHKRIMAVCPCGWGKTRLAISLCYDMTVLRDYKVLFLVHAECLVDQTIEAMAQFKLWAGAIAGSRKEHRKKNIQVAMIQTLERGRDISWFKPDFVITDEVHELCFRSWHLKYFPKLKNGEQIFTVHALDEELKLIGIDVDRLALEGGGAYPTFKEVAHAHAMTAKANHPDLGGDAEKMKEINAAWDEIRKHKDLFSQPRERSTPTLIGLTATPWRLSSRESMGDIFSVQVHGPTPGKMIETGRGVPYVYWGIEGADLDKIHTTYGEFNEQELVDALSVPEVIQTAVRNYKEKAMGRRFICFPVRVDHAKVLQKAFSLSGVETAVIEGNTLANERQIIYQKAKNKEILGIISVGCLCLDDQTEILTSRGWVSMNEMTFDHKVANWDNGKIFFDNPQDIVIRDRKPNERMVVFESRSTNLRVTENHDIVTTNQFNFPKGRFKKVKAIECVGKQTGIPVCGIAEAEFITLPEKPFNEKDHSRRVSANSFNLRKTHRMGHQESIKEAKARIEKDELVKPKNPSDLSLDECMLIGFWIGDGSVTKGKSGGTYYTLAQAGRYPQIIEWIEGILEKLGINYTKYEDIKRSDQFSYFKWHLSRGTGFGSQFKKGIKEIEPYLKKQPNDLLWGLNSDQFDALILGLWMSDGDHGNGKPKENYQYVIAGTEFDLLSQLQAIAVCRGYRAMLTGGPVKTRPKSKPFYRLRLKKQPWTTIGGGAVKFGCLFG